MEIIEVLFQNIEVKDFDAIKKIAKYIFGLKNSGEKNKILNAFSTRALDYFANCILGRNLWCVEQMCKYVSSFENQKRNDVFGFLDICMFLSNVERLDLSALERATIVQTQKIVDMVYGLKYEFKEIIEYKNIIDDKVFALMNVLYGNFMYNTHVHERVCDSLMIARYVIDKKPKDIFINVSRNGGSTNNITDGFDLLFVLVLLYLDNVQLCQTDYGRYIMSCKDLFYYRCKKGDKNARRNILFHVILVAITKKVSNQEIDIKQTLENNKMDTSMLSSKYIFAITHYDHKRVQEVRMDRESYSKSLKEDVKAKNVYVENGTLGGGSGSSDKYTILRQNKL